jgi:hypothetical protein
MSAVVSLGSTVVRAGRHGMSFISNKSPSAADAGGLENGAAHELMAQMTHLHAVRIVMLHLRQRAFLECHADALANLDWDHPTRARHDALTLEKALIRFQNKYWIARVPDRPAVASVVDALNQASELTPLLQDIADESSSISRVLELESAQSSQAINDQLNNLVGVFAVPAVILGLLALMADPSWELAAWGVGLSLLGGLVVTFALRRWSRQTRKDKGTPGLQP